MSYETIVVEKDGPLTTITLNRPDRLNAMPPQMADEIGAAFYDLGDSRAVLITGAGKGFCSGADLAARGEGSALQNKGGSHRALQNHYNPAINQVLRADVPVICAVNGPAAGVGCSLALAGDFVLAGKSAYFLQAFVNIGLVPDGGSTWLLARSIGRARATHGGLHFYDTTRHICARSTSLTRGQLTHDTGQLLGIRELPVDSGGGYSPPTEGAA